MELKGKEKAALTLRGLVLGGNSIPLLHNPKTACEIHSPERNKSSPGSYSELVLTRAPSSMSLVNRSLGKSQIRQMPPWGQAAWGPSVPHPPSLPLANPLLLPQPLTPPAGAQVGAHTLHLSEALLRLPFPEHRAPRGGGKKERPGGKRTENRREGELEQTKLGPELGVSGTAPISSILFNCLTTGQNLRANFYFRKQGEIK